MACSSCVCSCRGGRPIYRSYHTTFSLEPLRAFYHMVDIPFRRRFKVLCTIEHNEDRHGFLFHIVEIGQQLGSDQKVLPRVVGWIITTGTARRILDDALKDQTLIAIIKSLIDLVLREREGSRKKVYKFWKYGKESSYYEKQFLQLTHATKGGSHHVLQSHQVHDG
jgi:hypothetical protein